MKPIFDPTELDLTTDKERKALDLFDECYQGYLNGKVDGIKVRQAIAGAGVYAKRIQSRSAMAMIKYDREKRGEDSNLKYLTKA